MAGPQHAKSAKSTPLIRIWRIVDARDAPGGKSIRGVRICRNLQVASELGTGDAGASRLAEAQEGVVHREQLAALGMGRGAVAHRVRHARLIPVLPSVLAVGHAAISTRGRMIAALLSGGDDCVLSDDMAAYAWDLLDRAPGRTTITVAGRHHRSQPELRVRRVARLSQHDVRLRHGLPVTAPARTILDCAAAFDDACVAALLARARLARLVSDRELGGALQREPTRPGAARLRRVLATDAGAKITRSEAERRFLRLVADAELPRPEVNVQLGELEVDFLWRPERLVVEVDGWRHHSGRATWEHDRWRDQRLTALGLRVMRVTWRQLTQTPMAVAVRLAQALGSGPRGARRAG